MVATNARQLVFEAEHEVDAAEAGLAVDELDGVGHDLRQVGRAFEASLLSGLVPREIQQVADRVVDSLSLALNAAHELLFFVGT